MQYIVKNKYEFSVGILLILSILLKYTLTEPYFGNNGYFIEDDLFYYFEIAKNFYYYGGFTFDGLVQTNGFHPSWQSVLIMLYGAVMLVGEESSFQYYALFLNIIFYIVTAIMFYKILKNYLDSAFSFFSTVVLFFLCERYFINGMETVLVLLFTEILFLYLYKIHTLNQKINIYIVALISFLIVMSRLDALALVGMIYVFMWLYDDQEKYLKSFLIFVALLSLYLLANYFTFDTALPISGKVKAFWGELIGRNFILEYILKVVKNYFYYIFDPLFMSQKTIIDYTLIPIIGIVTFRLILNVKAMKNYKLPLIFISSIMIYFIVQLIYYSFFSAFIWRWYQGIGILFLYFIILISLLHFPSIKHNYRNAIYTILLIGIILLDVNYSINAVKNIKEKETWGKVSLKVNDWIENNTKKNDIIGSWAAGEIGYYSSRRVINLEGLVGDKELLFDNKNNTLLNYIDKHNIKYIIQWFPNSIYDKKLETLKATDNVLLGIRARVIYENKNEFKLIKKIDLKNKLRHYSVFIFKRVKS